MLAEAKREADKLGPPLVKKFSPWTDADREAWDRLISQATEAPNQH